MIPAPHTHRQAFRGHNLNWNNQNPAWLEDGTFTASEKSDILVNHINHVLAHYKGKAVAWGE